MAPGYSIRVDVENANIADIEAVMPHVTVAADNIIESLRGTRAQPVRIDAEGTTEDDD
jgi:hypothetical protein